MLRYRQKKSSVKTLLDERSVSLEKPLKNFPYDEVPPFSSAFSFHTFSEQFQMVVAILQQ